jgi:hypothetical protein
MLVIAATPGAGLQSRSLQASHELSHQTGGAGVLISTHLDRAEKLNGRSLNFVPTKAGYGRGLSANAVIIAHGQRKFAGPSPLRLAMFCYLRRKSWRCIRVTALSTPKDTPAPVR